MVIVDNILYLPAQELVKKYNFSQNQLDKNCHENRNGLTNNYQHIKGNDATYGKSINLIAFDSIPEATRTAKGLPSKDVLLKDIQASALSSLVIFSNEAYTYYLAQPATAKLAKEKAEQASWFIAIASAKTSQLRQLGFESKPDMYVKAIELMNARARERAWHAWKLNSSAELAKRLTPFQKYLKGELSLAQACGELISKKTGNSNAQKITFDQQAVMVQLYSDANAKPNFEQVWMIYTRKANEMIRLGHWSPDAQISPSTVRAFLMKPAIRQMWYEARHGYQEYRNVFEAVTQRERPTFANALWVIDGTPSHRYFQHGEQGRYFRFNIFPVLDAHSWCVLGFWLSGTENTDAVLGALRSACMVTGNTPHQILYDNSSAIQSYRAQAAIDKIAPVSFAATAGNARSKIIEQFFHLFNQDVQKFRPGYTANPFALTLNNRPNREALAKMVKSAELPSAELALKQAIEDLTLWNNTPRKFLGGLSPIDTYKQSVTATANRQNKFYKEIDIEAFYAFPGEQKKIRTMDEGKPKMVSTFIPQTYEFTNRGIEIVIDKNRFYYQVEDATFRSQFTGQRFSVRYEPNRERWIGDHPEELLLYLNGVPMQWNGQHLAATVLDKIPMAIADFKEGTRAQLDQRLSNKKQQRALLQNDFSQLIEHTKSQKTYTAVITDNAFDKKVIQDTNEELLNQIIQRDDYRLGHKPSNDELDGPREDDDEHDRLSGYDEEDTI